MKLILLTNMPSYHQVDLAGQLAGMLGVDNVRLVFEKNTSQGRKEMGWSDQFDAPYVIRYWESESAKHETRQWIADADVVIQGRFPLKLLRERIKAGKLTYAYQERFWKRRPSIGKILSRLPRIFRDYWSVNKPNYHLLAAGAYVAPDLHALGCFKNRSWKFGYFIDHDSEGVHSLTTQAERIKILWCARFYAVKQPFQALSILHKLVAQGMDCQLTMIGDGELRQACEERARELGLSERICFAGWQTEQEVAMAMRAADVFLMTSAAGEGWGVVVNEAMKGGCAVIANQSVGSAPWLIEHDKTGFIYRDSEIDKLVSMLIDKSHNEFVEMGAASAQRHANVWSAKIAASRLIELSALLLDQEQESLKHSVARHQFDDGPCSFAG